MDIVGLHVRPVLTLDPIRGIKFSFDSPPEKEKIMFDLSASNFHLVVTANQVEHVLVIILIAMIIRAMLD